MPLTYELGESLVRFTTKGDVEYNTGLLKLKSAMLDARQTTQSTGDRLWDLVFDLTQSTESRSEAELQGIAMALAQNLDILSGRMAIVVTDPHYVGVAEAFGVFAEKLGKKPRLFGTSREAEAWLAKPA